MRTEQVKIYKFTELSDTAKQRAIEWYREASQYDDWYESIYDDAKRIGLEITAFDTYHGTIKGKFITSGLDVMNRIFADHGESCETYKTALDYEKNLDSLPEMPDENAENFDAVEDEIGEKTDEYESEFLHNLLEDYLVMLRREYEFFNSDEYIAEIIEINEYEFSEDGKIWR